MKAVAFTLLCAACADPVVQMDVTVTNVDNIDLSCVGAVFVYADGKNGSVQGGTPDDVTACMPVSGLTKMSDVVPVLHSGQLTLGLPPSGLIGVEVSGVTGTCDAPGTDVFYGGAKYIGQDPLPINLVPQLSCAHENLRLRPVDLFALATDPTHACPPPIPSGPSTGMSYGVIEQTLFTGTTFWPGPDYYLTDGVMDVNDFTPVANPTACLAAYFTQLNDGPLTADGCLRISQNTVCAQPDEVEIPVVNSLVTPNLYSSAPDARFGGFVIGGVWGIDAAGNKAPLVGATVTVDPNKGRVVYADLAGANTAPTLDLAATSVKASGLFVVYTDSFVDLQVSAPGYVPETVRVAPVAGYPDAAVLVALAHQ
jgi:hypothetical protein